MNSECLRIADQLRRAFAGDAWHGPSLKKLLADVTPEEAEAHPIASAQAVQGVPMPKIVGTDKDWPPVTDAKADAWAKALDRLFQASRQLSQAIEGFTDERLQETVPGRQYNFYYLFHGVVQHSLYHGGQIALLKKAI